MVPRGQPAKQGFGLGRKHSGTESGDRRSYPQVATGSTGRAALAIAEERGDGSLGTTVSVRVIVPSPGVRISEWAGARICLAAV
jgi:hypothetical protein